jgi:cytochrome b involved in lipid metabolism
MCLFNNNIPQITLTEVMKHRNKESFWIIWKNKVYDITDFYYKHPGGSCILIHLNATPHMKFHSNNAKNILKSKFIGYLQIP